MKSLFPLYFKTEDNKSNLARIIQTLAKSLEEYDLSLNQALKDRWIKLASGMPIVQNVPGTQINTSPVEYLGQQLGISRNISVQNGNEVPEDTNGARRWYCLGKKVRAIVDDRSLVLQSDIDNMIIWQAIWQYYHSQCQCLRSSLFSVKISLSPSRQ